MKRTPIKKLQVVMDLPEKPIVLIAEPVSLKSVPVGHLSVLDALWKLAAKGPNKKHAASIGGAKFAFVTCKEFDG